MFANKRKFSRRIVALGFETLETRALLDAAPTGLPDQYSVIQGNTLTVDSPVSPSITSFSLNNLELVNTFQLSETASNLNYSSTGKVLTAYSSLAKNLKIFDPRDGSLISTLNFTNDITPAQFTQNGRFFFVLEAKPTSSGTAKIHRYDRQTNLWETKTIAGDRLKIWTIDDTHFMTFDETAGNGTLIIYDYGLTTGAPVTETHRVTNVSIGGSSLYDPQRSLIYTSNKENTGVISVFKLNGYSIEPLDTINIIGSGVLNISADGKKLYYGKTQIDLATKATEYTFSFSSPDNITGAAGNLVFARTKVFNATTGVTLASLLNNFNLFSVTQDEQYLWTVFNSKTVTVYRLPGAFPSILENDTDPEGQALNAELLTSPTKGQLTLFANGNFSYTASFGATGNDSFTYRAFDGVNYSAPVTVQIDIWPLLKNTTEYAYEATEDSTLTVGAAVGLVKGKTDDAGTPLKTTLYATTTHGSLNLNPDGSFTYTPNANFFGTDEFQYRIMNDTLRSAPGTVRIKVNPTQDNLDANDDSYTIFKNKTLTAIAQVSATTTSSNFPGLSLIQSLPFAAFLEPTTWLPLQVVYSSQSHLIAVRQNQSVTILNADNGSFVSKLTLAPSLESRTTDLDFTPDGQFLFVGESNLRTDFKIHRYGVASNSWISKTASYDTYRIEAVNSLEYLSGTSGSSLDVGYISFGSTPIAPVTTLFWQGIGYSGYGGNITYDAAKNLLYYAEGTDTQSFRTYRWQNNSFINISNVDFTSLNAPDNYGGVLSADGKTFFYGSLQIDTNNITAIPVRTYPVNILAALGNIAFANDRYFNSLTGEQLGTYGFSLGALGYDESGDSIWIYNNTTNSLQQYSIPGAPPHPKANDTDIDQETWNFNVETGVAHGTLAMNPDGSFQYTPALDYVGSDSFTYRVTDPGGFTDTATITINVQPFNFVPVAREDNYTVQEDQVLSVNAALGALANDTDAEGSSLTITNYSTSTKGLFAGNPDGSFIYTPNANFNGTDQITYYVQDNAGGIYAGTIKITVVPVPDAPVAVNDVYSVNEDTTLSVTSSTNNLLTNDTDIDGATVFTASLITPPALGTLTFNPDGKFTYVPPKDYFGTVTFQYQISDGFLLSNLATVTITVNPVNDVPVAGADRYLLPYSATSLTINAAQGLLANDSDVEGNPLTAVLVTNPVYGTVTLNSDGSFTYTKTADFPLSDTFTYRARDTANSNTQTVTIELDTGRIVVGTHLLQPNKANQKIPLYITGGAPLNGFNLRLQLGDGLAGSPEPIITAIDLTDSIWAAYPYQLLGGPVAESPQFVQASIVFDAPEHSVLSNGKLLTLTVDTTGFYGGNFSFRLRNTEIGENTDMILVGATEPSPMFLTNGLVTIQAATVTNRQTFYNNSYFDGNSALGNAADLTALATDKTALRPSQPATFQNYTSFSKGINGLIIDVQDFHYLPTLDEFEFRVGNTTTPGSWQLLTTPPELTLETLADGKLRIKLIWPDSTIVNQWLEVTIKAKGALGLPLDDVFYFGNAVGETGNLTGNSFVDGSDFAYVRDNPRNFLNRAPIDFRADINRDSIVDATDLGLVRDHPTNFITSLKIWTPPAHVTPARTPYVPPQQLSSLTSMPEQESSLLSTASATTLETSGETLTDSRQAYFSSLAVEQPKELSANVAEFALAISRQKSVETQKTWFGLYARVFWEQFQADKLPATTRIIRSRVTPIPWQDQNSPRVRYTAGRRDVGIEEY